MRSAKVIDTEAAEWIARLDGKAAAQWPPEFDAWFGNDPRHRAAFTRLQVAWKRCDSLRRLKPLDHAVATDPDLLAPRASVHEGLWTHANAYGVAQGEGYRTSNRAHWRTVLPLAAAALSLIVIAVSWLVLGDLHSRVYETSVGGHEHVLLPDGSVAELNTNTRIRVKFDHTRRAVELLQGEALFTVVHDPDRPFEVTVSGVTARAVGTQFSVRLREEGRVETLVKRGHVLMLQAQRMLGVRWGTRAVQPVLDAGDRAIVDGLTASIENVGITDVERRQRWTVGRIEFRGETVAEVVRELNRYTLQTIRVIDPLVAQMPCGGTFRTNAPEAFMAGLSGLYGANAFVAVH